MSKALLTAKEARLLDHWCPVKQNIEEVFSRKRHRSCSLPLGLVWGCCPTQSWKGGGEGLSCERGSGEGPCCGGVLGHDGYARCWMIWWLWAFFTVVNAVRCPAVSSYSMKGIKGDIELPDNGFLAWNMKSCISP